MKYEEYVNEIGFTDEELKLITDIDKKCRNDFPEELSLARENYDKGDEAFAEYLFAFADKAGIPVNTLNVYLYLRLMEDTYKEYERRGIGRDIFIENIKGFPVVSRLPLDVGQDFGFPQPVYRSWFRRNLDCTIYRLGRLEFELVAAPCDIEVDGKSVKEGETCISVHIPRFDSFEEEACEESYARAREFFKKYYNMDNIIFICHSWMLYPWLCEVLRETSTIARFQKKFKIIQVDETDVGIGWIFGSGAGLGKKVESIEDYPEDNSLRRAAKQRLREGKKLGAGLGARL